MKELKDDAERFSKAGPALIPGRDISIANLKMKTQEANIMALTAKKHELLADIDSKAAKVKQAQSVLKLSKINVERLQLAVKRTKITSPIDGIVQELYVAPGSKRMADMDSKESATVAKIYDPESMQARIDVPLDEAAQIFIKQKVRLKTSIFPNRIFQGEVTRIVGEANIQRNTVQVKVAIKNPDIQLRPEMLCRAEFLENPSDKKGVLNGMNDDVALYLNNDSLIQEGNEYFAWTVDSNNQARKVILEVKIRDQKENYTHVLSGLKPGEWVIKNPPKDLEVGEKVEYTKEEI